jgi:DNA-3-methyladenine glycosylase
MALDIARVRPLPRSFYDRDPREVGPDLLGKVIVRRIGKKLRAGRIVEDEAYLGAEDPAAHAYAGKTARNAVLFGLPGHAYVYLIYGNHYCLNVSCMPPGDAGCILIRALEPLDGLREMARARGVQLDKNVSPAKLRMLTSGPGRLCQAMAITRPKHNNADVTSRDSELWIGADGFRPEAVRSTTRIGITKAAEHALRYVIAGNEFVSGKRVP